ncbi:MAG: bifunctional phosphopantothenoylcysteine decarboxylase/phosphopantothenate--cysteine ligase CoaBC [Sulfurospirillaceae bacterium]|nr:bifunctional phosphopantothenoylcysteine decarboxylase/phosphopantothenate--cysteine ligase CoaBC [Sulfurospirillaceae bacterium]
MQTLLKEKRILVGVTGSIAIYKTLELVRMFVKAGAIVRVIMSEEAKRFITPLTFEAISQNRVLHVETESWADDNNHIHIGKWADIFVIAPISANTINKLSCGIADNLLTQIALAYPKKILIAPSANTYMILNPITLESMEKLKGLGFYICETQKKLLACNDEGVGAMAEPREIFFKTASLLLEDAFWTKRNVVITGGGSREKIDDVRCLTNFSSGKMANYIAQALYLKGANVTLITSATTNELPQEINILHVETTQNYLNAIETTLQDASYEKTPYLFMAGAISDFVVANPQKGKIKKESCGDTMTLELCKNIDILKTLDKKNIKTIGFKAEMDASSALESAKKMLIEKNLDAVCLNIIGEENHFGKEHNAITFITKNSTTTVPMAHKFSISLVLSELTKTL